MRDEAHSLSQCQAGSVAKKACVCNARLSPTWRQSLSASATERPPAAEEHSPLDPAPVAERIGYEWLRGCGYRTRNI